MVVHEEFTPGPDLVIDLTMQRGDGEWNVSVAHPPVLHAWPTMLGLLTIISDAIAAAPWWGDGEARVKVPEIGSSWVTLDGRTETVVHFDPAHDKVQFLSPAEWRFADLRAFSDGTLRPASVVPTPTADDWIDPAVRLPEVGEYVWILDHMGGVTSWQVYERMVDYDWWHGINGWAPILVGPPPIPDASDAPDDQAVMDQTARARAEAISPNPEFIEGYMARWLHLPTTAPRSTEVIFINPSTYLIDGKPVDFDELRSVEGPGWGLLPLADAPIEGDE
jgi:hypothetical protein